MTPVRKDAVGFGAYGEAFAKFTDQEWRELFRAYCAGTSFMDAQLGRVLDALDKHQLWDKTLVIFVGDHGYHTGERQWWNKNTLFERSCRAPLIIAAPGMKGGQTTPLARRVRRSLSHRRRLLRPENAPRRRRSQFAARSGRTPPPASKTPPSPSSRAVRNSTAKASAPPAGASRGGAMARPNSTITTPIPRNFATSPPASRRSFKSSPENSKRFPDCNPETSLRRETGSRRIFVLRRRFAFGTVGAAEHRHHPRR